VLLTIKISHRTGDRKGILLRSVGAKQSVGSGQGLGDLFCKTKC
jgi:hypothetical protein